MDLSIIIVNYNTFELTCNCISSVIKETKVANYEIILVDNASYECSAEQFLVKFPFIKLVTLTENLGFGIANNKGMEIASSDYYLLLNSDTIILDGALDKCFNLLKQQKVPTVLGCKLLNEDGSWQPSHFVDENSVLTALKVALRKNLLFYRLFPPKAINDEPSEIKKVAGVSGAFILIDRTIVETVGGFDPDFFMYCEETEWFRNRITPHYPCLFYPGAQVIHLLGASSKKVAYTQLSWSRKQNILSFYLFWYKIGMIQYWSFVFLNLVSQLFNYIILLFLRGPKYLEYRAEVKFHLSILDIIFINIPKYSRGWGSRPEFLKLKQQSKS